MPAGLDIHSVWPRRENICDRRSTEKENSEFGSFRGKLQHCCESLTPPHSQRNYWENISDIWLVHLGEKILSLNVRTPGCKSRFYHWLAVSLSPKSENIGFFPYCVFLAHLPECTTIKFKWNGMRKWGKNMIFILLFWFYIVNSFCYREYFPKHFLKNINFIRKVMEVIFISGFVFKYGWKILVKTKLSSYLKAFQTL